MVSNRSNCASLLPCMEHNHISAVMHLRLGVETDPGMQSELWLFGLEPIGSAHHMLMKSVLYDFT